MSPKRVQRKRTKGWRMPENTVYVGRPTIYGNPFRPVEVNGTWLVFDDNDVDYEPYHNTKASAVRRSVELFANDFTYWLGGRMDYQPGLRESVKKLEGKNLACWCPLDQPCHADVLLELANQ